MARRKQKTPKRERLFVYLSLFSLLLFVLGLFVDESVWSLLEKWIQIDNQTGSLGEVVSTFGFSLSAWVFLFGLFFVKKKGRIWGLLIILLLPHLAFLYMGYALGAGPAELLDRLLFDLRFGGLFS